MYDKEIRVRKDKILGYEYFLDREHPLGSTIGRVYYHRHIVSLSLGRWLRPNEMVQHKDGDKANNDLRNLEVITKSKHSSLHYPKSSLGVRNTRKNRGIKKKRVKCKTCGRGTQSTKFCSPRCSQKAQRRVKRPTKKHLENDLSRMSWSAVGRKYGVSDNAVRKWARTYGLL